MTQQEYNTEMVKLLKQLCQGTIDLEKTILKAHQTIEEENKVFLNLSHKDINRFKKRFSK